MKNLLPKDLRAGRLIGAFAVAVVLPSVAWADAPSLTLRVDAPVQVTSCRVESALLSTDTDRPADVVAGPLWFGLRNERAQTATEVTLQVAYAGQIHTLVESGVFSSGVRVDRKSGITAYAPWVGSRPESCTVVAVKFANGAAWLPRPNASRGAG